MAVLPIKINICVIRENCEKKAPADFTDYADSF